MNEQQKSAFSSRFPWLDEGQISRLVEVVDSMGYTDPIQKLEKQRQLYQQVLPVIKEKQHKIGRVEVQNQLFHNRENAKSTDDFVKNDVLLKTSEFADLFRNAYGLPSKVSDDKIMEALKNGDPDFKNKFARYMNWDKEVLQEMGIGGEEPETEEIQGAFKWMFRPQWNEERNDNLFGRLKATDEATTVGGVLKEFWMNTLKSTVNLASDLGNMVANPWDTAKGLTKWVLGGIANAVGADDRLAERSDFWAGANETADAMGSAIAERYGSFDKFSKTAYTDPVGVFSDIMSVITLGAWATRIGAKLGMKGSQAAQLTKTAWKLAKVADVAGGIAKVADAVDPANIMMKGAGKVVGYWLWKAKKWIKALDLGEKTKSIISGLDKDTRKGIQNNPYVSEYWKEAKNIIEQDGVPQDIKELSRPQYEKVASDLLNTISRAKEAFSESWPLYQKIREINAKVDITPALEEIKNVLEKHDIKVLENWALDFGYSSIVKNEDMHAISTLLERVNGGLVDDANTVLNLRKVSDQLSKWDSGTTSEGMKVIRDIRKEIDNVAKEQIPGLEELDKLYRSRIDDLNQIQEGIVYRQGDRRGQVRDNFNQIIKTIWGENRARMAERLGEIAPDLLERVSAIHGVEKLAKAYTNTPKLSKLAGPLTWAVGLWYLTNSWTGAVVGALVSYFWDSIFSKISKAHLNKIASKMSPEALTKLEEINEKIAKRTLLSETDKALLNKIKAEIVNWKNDWLLALEYKDYNWVIGDQTKIITDPNGNSWREGQIAEINNQKNLPKEEGLGKLREWAETKYQLAEPIKSENFKKWFGDWENDPKSASKVVDAEGKPLLMYHGSPEKFTIFDSEFMSLHGSSKGYGFYFSPDKNMAQWYGDLMQVYLDIKNPLSQDKLRITRSQMKKLILDVEKNIAEKWGSEDGTLLDNFGDTRRYGRDRVLEDAIDMLMENENDVDVFGELKHIGGDYDSVAKSFRKILGKDWIITPKEYIVFESNQIKSATDNIWTFDANNPDIRYQKHWIANPLEKSISAQRATQLENIRNGKSVQELADHYGIDIKTIETITTPEGLQAYGKYGDWIISLAEKIKEGTAPHELFHGVFDLVDRNKKESILRQIEKSKGLDNLNAEEYLADSFSEYFRTGKFDTKSFGKGLVEKIKQYFYQVKQFITGANKNKAQIKKLFDEILDGEIKHKESIVWNKVSFQILKQEFPDLKEVGEWEFGTIYEGVKWTDAEQLLIKQQGGEVRGAYTFEKKPVDLIRWSYNKRTESGIGLSKISQKHPEVLWKIQDLLDTLPILKRDTKEIVLWDKNSVVVIKLQYLDQKKRWIMTAYDRKWTKKL